MMTLIVAIASAFALTACGETNGNGGSNTGNTGNGGSNIWNTGNGDNTENTIVVTPGGGNKDTDDNDNPESRQPKNLNIRYSLTILMK